MTSGVVVVPALVPKATPIGIIKRTEAKAKRTSPSLERQDGSCRLAQHDDRVRLEQTVPRIFHGWQAKLEGPQLHLQTLMSASNATHKQSLAVFTFQVYWKPQCLASLQSSTLCFRKCHGFDLQPSSIHHSEYAWNHFCTADSSNKQNVFP